MHKLETIFHDKKPGTGSASDPIPLFAVRSCANVLLGSSQNREGKKRYKERTHIECRDYYSRLCLCVTTCPKHTGLFKTETSAGSRRSVSSRQHMAKEAAPGCWRGRLKITDDGGFATDREAGYPDILGNAQLS